MSSRADPVDRSDDIAQLRRHLDLPELSYQDISMMVGLRQSLQRWPLLGESCALLMGDTAREAGPVLQAVEP
ncbi:cellulose biosynthesis protein BcsR [Pseudomonas sp. X10]